ncbi:MAG TPA: ATP-binding protein [Woeseiaceae bacterium]|nr:ATP-binding protein [Woeseiaceae bacterium]
MWGVNTHSGLRRYGVALAALAVAVGLRLGVAPFLEGAYPHALTFAAVAIAVWHGGAGPAAMVAVVGYFLGHVLFVGGLPFGSVADLVGSCLYGLSFAAVIGCGAAVRRARDRAEARAQSSREQQRDLERETEVRSASERATHERYERIRNLADGVPALLWASDADGACTFVNREWHAFTGLEREALLGEGWTSAIHPDDRPHVEEMLADAAAHRRDFTVFYRMRHHDGTWRWVIHRGRPLLRRHGELAGYLGSLMDITEEKAAQEALREADRRKDEFIATLAHELRNPLAPIRNAVQILHLENAPESMRENARDMIDRQVRHLARLVDDLLDISRITLGRLLLQTEETNLADVIRSAVEASRPLIDASGHTLSVALPTEPVFVDADPTRLAQVFVNLLNNAAKYTPPGGNISLLAAREGDTIVARVKDTGIGIPPDVLPRVFDTFTRVDHAADPSRAGLGIGLSLARHLVELHGGQIEACSDGPGHGSEFLVRLPVCVGAAGTQASREPAHGWETAEHRALRILVVDDNVDAAESISQLLRVAGHETHVAHDGLQAIEASARLDPDIVILDIGLPSVDGYEVARAIRGRGNGGHPRLIALTGWGQDEDKRLAAEAGFDRHLTKPVDPVLLRKIVEQGDVAAGDGAPAG